MSDTREKTLRDEDQHLPAKDDHRNTDATIKAASLTDFKHTFGKIY